MAILKIVTKEMKIKHEKQEKGALFSLDREKTIQKK
jgi:hypothetical protein